MTQQRAADRLATVRIEANGHVIAADSHLAEAIELGLLLLSDDGPKALGERLFYDGGTHRIQGPWRLVGDAFRSGYEQRAAAIIAALRERLRE